MITKKLLVINPKIEKQLEEEYPLLKKELEKYISDPWDILDEIYRGNMPEKHETQEERSYQKKVIKDVTKYMDKLFEKYG